jgi:hypothetical protein
LAKQGKKSVRDFVPETSWKTQAENEIKTYLKKDVSL